MAIMDSSSRLHRFSFTSFDAKEETPVEKSKKALKTEQPPPPMSPLSLPLTLPAITEKDVQNARTEAQAQGYREGYAAAQSKFDSETAAREEAVNALLEVIANRITIAAETHAANVKDREALMGKLVMAAARKVADEALKREPYQSVETLLKECMGLIAGKPQITIVASSTLAAGLKQRIDMLKPLLVGFTGDIKIEEDDSLLNQDCKVEWENGYGERNIESLWQAIEAIVVKTNLQG